MEQQPFEPPQPSYRQVFAHTSCLCLGLALIVWGLAPVLVDRVLTGQAPTLQAFAFSSVTLVVGLIFIGLHLFIRRDVRWALWAAFGTSLAITTIGLAVAIAAPSAKPSLFTLVLAGGTTVTTWLAIIEQREQPALFD